MKLQEGNFMGDKLSQRCLDNFTITMTRHESHTTVPVHEHEHPYISLLLSGHYQENSFDSDEHILPGYVLFRPAQYEHENRISQHQGVCFNLEIKSEVFIEGLSEIADAFICFDKSDLEVHKMYYGYTAGLSDELLNIQLEENAIHLFKYHATDKRVGNAHWIPKVRAHVRNNLQEVYSIEKIADFAAVHPNYFVRKFKEKTGYTFGAYLIKSRLEYAIDQMVYTQKPLTEISYSAGFYDQSHFVKHFKMAFNTTPTRYRTLVK